MKKLVVSFLVALLSFQSAAIALSDKESEYKWNKLDLKTRFSTQVSGYMSEGRGMVTSQDVENWYITKGGKEISEMHYLKLMGKHSQADKIRSDIDAINSVNITSWIISGLSITYAFIDVFDGDDQYMGVMLGCIVGLAAAFYPLFNQPPTHYLKYEEVGPEIDIYNAKLRTKLGIKQ